MLAKEFFPRNQRTFDGKRLTGVTELIGKIEIPRSDSSISGTNFEILVGFDLSEERSCSSIARAGGSGWMLKDSS